MHESVSFFGDRPVQVSNVSTCKESPSGIYLRGNSKCDGMTSTNDINCYSKYRSSRLQAASISLRGFYTSKGSR